MLKFNQLENHKYLIFHCHLNTSHVKVQLEYFYLKVQGDSNLNTSHVKVQRLSVFAILLCFELFKYISC